MAISYVKVGTSQVIDSDGNNVIIGTGSELTDVPDAIFAQELEYKTLITNTNYGEERRRNKWDTPKHSFTLQYIETTPTILSNIRNLFDDKSNLESFFWTHPTTSKEYTVRFIQDTLDVTYIAYERYNIQVDLVEIL